jgi:uncharacterized Zn finger protein
MRKRDKAYVVNATRNHNYVQFGKGKYVTKCHKCGTVRHAVKPTYYYEKDGVRYEESPECNETIYN